MTTTPAQGQPRYKTWAARLLLVLVIPLAAASLGVLYALYLGLTTGKLNTVAKGFRATSTSVSFADSPVWFAVFILLNAVLALTLIVVTVVVARLAYNHLRPRKGTPP
jgi:hypothetical protein